MKRYLLDSNHIELLARSDTRVTRRAIEIRKNGSVTGTATPIAGEYLAGVAKNFPLALGMIDKLRMWPYDFAAAEEYARLFAELRKRASRCNPST